MQSYKELDEDSSFLKMPPLDGAEYIVFMLQEAGTMSTTGMGVVPLSWQEIDAWLRVTDFRPALWERLMVRELSEVYVNEFMQASDRNRPQPYVHQEEPEEINRDAVENKLINALRGFKFRA
jgi:hypothetical protein